MKATCLVFMFVAKDSKSMNDIQFRIGQISVYKKRGTMKITIIFPAREFEIGKPTMPVMPVAQTLLAALTPKEYEISLIDMF